VNAHDAALAASADAIEASAFREMVAAAPADFAERVGLACRQVGSATLLLAPGIPDTLFNRAIGLGVGSPATEAGLDAAIAAYRDAGSAKFWIHWNPHGAPRAVPQWLAARGFSLPPRRAWAKVARDTESPPEFETNLELRSARPGEEDAGAQAIAGAFGMPAVFVSWFAALSRRPRWRMGVALAGSQVVGAGLVYFEGGEAWLGAGGVLREFRGRGAHRALMALRIREAAAEGCTRVFTETGEPIGEEPNPSLANMERCGFRRVCSRLNYAPSA